LSHRFWSITLSCLLAWHVGTAVSEPVLDPLATEQRATRLDPQDVAAWLDGYFELALRQYEIAGAAVVVVDAGQVLVEKGYGYADLDTHRRIDPKRTLLRTESISKLFTATAVMQLVEQRKIALDTDVNQYLDFQLPPAFGQPITLRNLLTHTAGFAEAVKDSSHIEPELVPALDDYLREHIPVRLFAPGTTQGYSNYSSALAGYIVQRISGEAYVEYIERHILQPLDMRSSTCRQPVPQELQADMAKAYSVASAPAQPFELMAAAPAGCLSAPVADMAKFMIAHLQQGRYGERQILQPATARAMHARSYSGHPDVLGNAIGFFDADRNGQRVIGHGGNGLSFVTDLYLVTDANVGIYVVFNSDGQGMAAYQLRAALFEEFMNRYFPVPPPKKQQVTKTAREHAQLAQGIYQSGRRLTGILSMIRIFNEAHVTALPDGSIEIAYTASGVRKRWHEVGSFLWRDESGQETATMRVEDGRVAAIYRDPTETFLSAPTWRTSAFVMPLLGTATGVLMLTVIGWPIAAVVRRRYSVGLELQGRALQLHRLTRVAALVMLVFLLGWVMRFASVSQSLYVLNSDFDSWVRTWQVLGLVATAGTGTALWNVWVGARQRRSAWALICDAAIAAACVSIVWFAFAFDVITFNLEY
jgi:CubicO group peptidase (beta-lactamase class C family)